MSNKTEQICTIVADMQKSNDAYYAGAQAIADMLSPGEKEWLQKIFADRPIWRAFIKDNVDVLALLSYKLLTWTSYLGNEGYVTGTFAGFAVLKTSQSKGTLS